MGNEEKSKDKKLKLAIISAIEILLIVRLAIQNKQYFNSPVSSISKKVSSTTKIKNKISFYYLYNIGKIY